MDARKYFDKNGFIYGIEEPTQLCGYSTKCIKFTKSPINSSVATMKKWQGICSSCLTDKEKFMLMLDMNNDIKRGL